MNGSEVGMALEHGEREGKWEEGLEHWNRWSAGGAKYKEEEMRSKWDSFDSNGLENPVTWRYLLKVTNTSTHDGMREGANAEVTSSKKFDPSPGFRAPMPLSQAPREVPDPIIWLDDGTEGGNWHAPVLRAGEVALLTGAGGVGKSHLAMALAAAATNTSDVVGRACGLCVATCGQGGKVLYMSYEETLADMRLSVETLSTAWTSIDQEEALGRIHALDDPSEIWELDKDGRGMEGQYWRDFWGLVEEFSYNLIVIDNVEACLASMDIYQSGPVRAFVRALQREARRLQCGVLFIAHPTKEATKAIRQGEITPGIVAGSGAFWHASRCVMALWETDANSAILEIVKNNHGPCGWGVELRRGKVVDGAWQGWVHPRILDRDEIASIRVGDRLHLPRNAA